MEDPLEEISGLSLFTRNLDLKPSHSNNNNNNDDPDSTHLFIKSMELGNSNKYLEQVKSNVDILSSKELLNQEIAGTLIANNENEAVLATEIEVPRVRRPGFGRTKAKFSMIPKSSQPSLMSEPINYAELSKDPREFFAYFDRREKAEKELKRLRGEKVIDDEFDFSFPIPERQRRKGHLGRTVTYKHLYPSSTRPKTNDTSMSSHKTLEEVISSPVKPTSEPESVDPSVRSEKKSTEDKIGKLLKELLSCEDLDNDKISSLMLDRLQIKSYSMDEKIPIPSFESIRDDIQRRIALSSIQNIPQKVGGKMPAKEKQQVGKTLSQALASSRPSLSPLAPISAFQKQIRQSNMWSDHFSSFELSPPKNSSPPDVDEQLDCLGTESNDSTFNNLESPEMITGKSVKDQFSRPEISTDAEFGLKEGYEAVTNVDDVDREATPSSQVKEIVGSSSRDHADFQTAGTDGSNKKVESMSQNAEHFNNDVSTAERVKSNGHKTDNLNHAATETSNIAENISVDHAQDMDEHSEMHLNGTTVEIPQRSIRKRKQVLSSQSLAEERADNPKDDQNIVEALPQKGRKKVAKKPLGVPLNDQTNGVPLPKNRKKKDFARRSSLAGAGSRWEEGGLRRSTRIRTKPLKFWKGERFVYGRVHESLATIIGLKYDSPEQGADNCFKDTRNLKVKSFVSAELEELVMRNSLY